MFNLTTTWAGLLSLGLFVPAMILVGFENKTHLPKSIPVNFVGALIWVFLSMVLKHAGKTEVVEHALLENITEIALIFFFLLAATTFINMLEDRNIFEALRSVLIRKGLSYRVLYFVTGFLAFVISPFADNMTTAMIMGAVVLAVGGNNASFSMAACINIVAAANAGGAISPFGDITTLMVWAAKGYAPLVFLHLLPAAIVNWIVPAVLMLKDVPKGSPVKTEEKQVRVKRGGWTILFIFICTIGMTGYVVHHLLNLPAALGMMLGMFVAKFYGYFLGQTEKKELARRQNGNISVLFPSPKPLLHEADPIQDAGPFRSYDHVSRIEWDSLFFFVGALLCVGGLAFAGYLRYLADHTYGVIGPFYSNTLMGLISAIIDNIPVMYSILSMNPAMGQEDWLMAAFTTGVGGSITAFGSAAGVALMSVSNGRYTIGGHAKKTGVLLVGYMASVAVQFAWNHFVLA